MGITIAVGNDVPVIFESWEHWRRDCQEPALEPAPLLPADTVFCAHCWGKGVIFSAAGNGEGLVPRVCEGCDGARLVARRPAGEG